MKKFLLAAFFLFSLVNLSWGQDDEKGEQKKKIERSDELEDQIIRGLREKMHKDMQQIQKLLAPGIFGDDQKEIEERFRRILESFYGENGDDFFQDQNFDKFLKKWRPQDDMDTGQTHWMETPKERILLLKMDVDPNTPLTIDIKDDAIKIAGSSRVIEKLADGSERIFYRSVNLNLPVPQDCLGTQAKIENQDGSILIKLPKKSPGKVFKPHKLEDVKERKKLKKLPKGDVTI